MRAGGQPPFREDLSTRDEKQPLLEAVTRKRLVKTQHAGKDLACAVEICDGAVITGGHELYVSINPISNPKPRL
jgi:hypothetical protein